MSKLKAGLVAFSFFFAAIAATVAQAAPGDTLGVSTLVQRILPTNEIGYSTLMTSAGENYLVRDGSSDGAETNLAPLGSIGPSRGTERTSLAYFGQLTDFQLADEESPARVEFVDSSGGPFEAAWRPGEALNPQEENAMIEQFNSFAHNPPALAGDGAKPEMDFVVNTGDIADSQQYNEVLWNRQLVEGDMVDPGSGQTPPAPGTNPLCPNSLTISDSTKPDLYTGTQDRDDWPASIVPGYFYDPDNPNYIPPVTEPLAPYADAPDFPGLLDRAEKPFQATGLDVPSYMVFGNHDGLVQGNVWATELFNEIAQGCLKAVADAEENGGVDTDALLPLLLTSGSRADFLQLYEDQPDLFMGVPPDPERRLVNKKEFMNIFKASGKDHGHGFGFVDAQTAADSNGSAGYYSWSPRPGVRFITLDTHSEGGDVLFSSSGNLDTPQFDWYENELQKATENNEIVVTFSHHALGSMDADLPDENAPSCLEVDPSKDIGCDADPRISTPIKIEDDIKNMILKYPHMIAWVAGHSHVNDVTPFKNPNGDGGFWSIRTSALADWPKQNRLVQIFDNHDGNLSIFGTLIDQGSPVPTPAPGTDASTMTTNQLASISRELGYNDSQTGGRGCGADPCGEGLPEDRNVELLIKDPRRDEVVIPPKEYPKISKVRISPNKKRLKAGKKMKLIVRVTNSGTAVKKNAKLFVKSSNKRVKVRKKINIRSIDAGETVKIRITVRAKSKARGKAKITANVSGKKARAHLKIVAAKRR